MVIKCRAMMWFNSWLLVFVLTLTIIYAQKKDSVNASQRTNSLVRLRRFLTFPPKSKLRLSACLAKAGLLLAPPAFVFTFDMDLAFDLPENSDIFLRGRSSNNHRDRREAYETIEALLERQGFDGRACVLRTLCEAQQVLAPGKDGLMEDIFHAIFTLPQEEQPQDIWQDEVLHHYNTAHRHGRSNQNCAQLYSSCPVSLINLALW